MQSIATADQETKVSPPPGPAAAAAAGPFEVALRQGGPELLAELGPAWDALCDRSRPELAFLRPTLVRAYLQAFAPSAPLVVLVGYRRGELVAVLPLVERSLGRGPLRVRWLESAGNVHFPRFDALCGEEDPEAVARGFWDLLRAHPGWLTIQLAVAPLDGVVSRMRALAAAEGAPTGLHHPGEAPYIDLPEPTVSIDELMLAQRKKLRRSLRQGRSGLEERGDLRLVTVRGTGPEGDIADWLARFCALEHRGWKGEGGTSILSRATTRAYYAALARDPALRQQLVCVALLLDDELVSAGLGLVAGTTYFGMKLAINEHYREYSPGHLLFLYRAIALSRLGCTVIDLGGRADPHKMMWTSTTRPFGYIFLFRQGLRGRVVHDLLFMAGGPGKRMLKIAPIQSLMHREHQLQDARTRRGINGLDRGRRGRSVWKRVGHTDQD